VTGGIPVTRLDLRLSPDPCRVITRPYVPGEHSPVGGRTRVERIVGQVLDLSPSATAAALDQVRAAFAERHEHLEEVLQRGFDDVSHRVPTPTDLAPDVQRLIGAYFVHEYSIEAAALTNPSLVAAPDQSGLPPGSVRFIASLRAVGEGHISSIEFRTGVLDADGEVSIDPAAPPLTGERRAPVFERRSFAAKLAEIEAGDAFLQVMDQLDDHFTMQQLEVVLRRLRAPRRRTGRGRPREVDDPLARELQLRARLPGAFASVPAGPVPRGPSESHGMEDARFVRFTRDDGSASTSAPTRRTTASTSSRS
jgi:hypothetical protein